MKLALHEWGDAAAPRVVCLHGVRNHGRHFARLSERLPGYHPELFLNINAPADLAQLGRLLDRAGGR